MVTREKKDKDLQGKVLSSRPDDATPICLLRASHGNRLWVGLEAAGELAHRGVQSTAGNSLGGRHNCGGGDDCDGGVGLRRLSLVRTWCWCCL